MTGPEVTDRLGQAVLRHLARHASDQPLGEMAREVLAGRMTLREAVNGTAYGEAFAVAAEGAVRALDAMTPEERAEAEATGVWAADVLDPPPPPPAPAPVRVVPSRRRRAPVEEEDWDESLASPWDR